MYYIYQVTEENDFFFDCTGFFAQRIKVSQQCYDEYLERILWVDKSTFEIGREITHFQRNKRDLEEVLNLIKDIEGVEFLPQE